MIDDITAALLGVKVRNGERQEVDGVFYRRRRGKVVIIPKEWVGNVTTKQTQRKRKKIRDLKDANFQKIKYQYLADDQDFPVK